MNMLFKTKEDKEISFERIGGRLSDGAYYDIVEKNGELGFVVYKNGEIDVPFITNLFDGPITVYVPHKEGLLYLDTNTPLPKDYESETFLRGFEEANRPVERRDARKV